MNASSPLPEQDVEERDMRAELISHFHLPADAVDKIYESMQTNDLTFSATALQLGLVTAVEIDEARARARRVPVSEGGLVESAINRVKSNRQVVLRPSDTVTPGKQLILAHDQHNPRSERLRALRTELLLLNEAARGANIIAVVSPCAGEGRSQLCAELAISFAQLNRRTLLVDADMRKPQQHALFGSANEFGLSQVIAQNRKPVYHPVEGLPKMHLVTSGPIPRNPLELLSDGRFEQLLTDWRNSYDFLVIDTPPVKDFADGLAVATMAGRVLVLSRAQYTSYKNTRELLRRLQSTQSTILGAVLNHF